MITKWRKNWSKSILNFAKPKFDIVTRLGLRSIVSKRRAHLAGGFFISKWSFKIETTQPYGMCMVSTSSRVSKKNKPTTYHGFFYCFGCNDINWAFRVLAHTRSCSTTLTFSKLFYCNWTWWWRIPIVFIKVSIGLKDVFFEKHNLSWVHEIHFVHFHQKLMRLSVRNSFQTQTKWCQLIQNFTVKSEMLFFKWKRRKFLKLRTHWHNLLIPNIYRINSYKI